jgi:quercetin dioxygenase-like cupin family protein
MKTHGYIKLISSADKNKNSVIEFNIIPNEKTPWHYHTLFSETFEVINGTLEVGLNKQVSWLKKGDRVTIKPNEKHYFHNISNDDCLIKVTVSPGNKNFENALLISKGLAKDGLASAAGTPKKLADLALFVYLNNSKMVGLQKVAEPLFNYLAKNAIKNGRLKELELKYCGQSQLP